MTTTIWAVYANGDETLLRAAEDFERAITRALDLAEKYGLDSDSDVTPPTSIYVRRDDTIALSPTVIRGGLATRTSR